MRVFILIFTLPFNVNADDTSRAVNMANKAIQKYSYIKNVKNKIGRVFYSKIPIDKGYVDATFGIAKVAVDKKVDLNSIKNIDIKFLKGNLKPNMTYNFKENKGNASINWSLKW